MRKIHKCYAKCRDIMQRCYGQNIWKHCAQNAQNPCSKCGNVMLKLCLCSSYRRESSVILTSVARTEGRVLSY